MLMQPGDTIGPNGVEPQQAQPQNAPSSTLDVRPSQEPQETGWSFTQEDPPQTDRFQAPAAQDVSWTASEFIEYEKSSKWYIALGGITLLLVVIVYLSLQDITTVAVIIVISVIFGVIAARKPRTLEYSVGDDGIKIGNTVHSYHDFKSFSVNEEGVLHSIVLLPIKRFMPVLTLYFEPKDEDAIVDTISAFLPFEQHQPTAIDRLMERIRF